MVVILDKELQEELKKAVDENWEWFEQRLKDDKYIKLDGGL